MMQIGSDQWNTLIQQGASSFSVSLDDYAIKAIVLFAKELLIWTKKINLTSITAPEEIAEKHFVDSLAIAPFVMHGASVLDIGTGAGFPGIPLKIALPELQMTLIDASVKKISFVKHIVRLLGLKNITAKHMRAEDFSQLITPSCKFDIVLCRAFSSLDDFLGLAIPFLTSEGSAMALKGNFPVDEIKALGGVEARNQIIYWNDKPLKMDISTYHLPFSRAHRSLIRFTSLYQRQ